VDSDAQEYASAAPSIDLALESTPAAWGALWGKPNTTVNEVNWRALKRDSRSLADSIRVTDERTTFQSLVGSAELSSKPVHRWFAYKEGFSPDLLGRVLDKLDAGSNLNIVDPFGGVGTTALAGLLESRVQEVRSVEYSPLAHFIGRSKLESLALDGERLRGLADDALNYPKSGSVEIPHLSSLKDTRIFTTSRVAAIVRARDHIQSLKHATPQERAFLLVGLGAVVEDLSGIMKDGRALRIVDGRRRRPSSLARDVRGSQSSSPVKAALGSQWSYMIDDLGTFGQVRANVQAQLLRGDARDLTNTKLSNGKDAFPDGWADVSCFSPPYLNFIDYTEVHKLELWLLGFVESQEQMRTLRRGTLRSHPSVRFHDEAPRLSDERPETRLINGLEAWLRSRSLRPGDAIVIRQYFEDMFAVFQEQHRVLRSGGTAVCVVANSTFSRRTRQDDGTLVEEWRVPVLTDVLLAHVALSAGFEHAEVWEARRLRPRNVNAGSARESLVVARKH